MPGNELLAQKDATQKPDLNRLLIGDLISQLQQLAGGLDRNGDLTSATNVAQIAFPSLNRRITAFESDTSDQNRGDIFFAYKSGLAGDPNFTTPIEDGLTPINSNLSKLKLGSLTNDNIVDRVRTQTCAGCHQFSDTVTDTPKGKFGFDPPGSLGLNSSWPSKACGDIAKDCTAGIDFSPGIGQPVKNNLLPSQHPPMQFTHISEVILTRAVSDGGWRYAISTTAECLINPREELLRKLVNDTSPYTPAPCAPAP